MLLVNLREDIHDFYLNLRMLDRILETEEFERSYESAVDFRILKMGIEQLDIELIKFFILLNRDPGELSLRELRKAAKHYNVAFWSRLNKVELIGEVIDARQYCRTREIDRQIDLLSNPSKDQASDANRRDSSSRRCTVSRSFGIYHLSASATRVEISLRLEKARAREHVGEHGSDGCDGSERTEDTRDVTNGPQILLEN